MQQSCCAASLALVYQEPLLCFESWPTLPLDALCLFSVGQPSENSNVWKSPSPWPVSSTGQERRKHHQWAKELLETEWKPGNEKVFFPLNSQRLLNYYTRRISGSPMEVLYLSILPIVSLKREEKERVPSVPQKTLKALQQLENSKPMTSISHLKTLANKILRKILVKIVHDIKYCISFGLWLIISVFKSHCLKSETVINIDTW